MAYERVAISDSDTSTPTQAPSVMREERVMAPYGRPKPAAPAASTGQEDTSGSVAAKDQPATTESVALSPQVAALARKEQKFRQQQLELSEQKKALEAERAEIAEMKAMKAKLAAKDYSGIEGQVDYEAYTQYLLDKQAGQTPEQQALKKLEAEVEGVKKAHQDSISKQFEAAVSERRNAVKKLVDVDESFATIKDLGQQEAVVQHILDTWEHDSQELSVEDAAKEVEELLLERANKWASVRKLKKSPATPPADEKKQLPPMKQGLKTITNQVTTGDIKKPVKPLSLMNEAERYAEARRRALEKLNSQQRQG